MSRYDRFALGPELREAFRSRWREMFESPYNAYSGEEPLPEPTVIFRGRTAPGAGDVPLEAIKIEVTSDRRIEMHGGYGEDLNMTADQAEQLFRLLPAAIAAARKTDD